MTSLKMIAGTVVAVLMTVSTPLLAAEQASGGTAAKSEPIYGYRMMSGPERNEYREKMRNAKSADERQALREGHHKLMSERAKERCVTLPERGGPGGGRGPCAAGEMSWTGRGAWPRIEAVNVVRVSS